MHNLNNNISIHQIYLSVRPELVEGYKHYKGSNNDQPIPLTYQRKFTLHRTIN